MQAIGYRSQGDDAGACLVMPPGDGPFPVVIYAPGLSANVAEVVLDDAVALAQEVYAGLLIYEPQYSVGFTLDDARGNCRLAVKYVVQERRALDLLETLPKIDTERVAFVGWSRGALVGGVLAGVDDRVKAYVLIGLSIQKRSRGESAANDGWYAQCAVVASVAYLGHNKRAAFCFVNGKDDKYAMGDAKTLLAAAAPRPRVLKVCEGAHGSCGAALARPWLKAQLETPEGGAP